MCRVNIRSLVLGINYNKQAAVLQKMQSLKTIQRIGYIGMGSYNPDLETLPGWDDTYDNNANVDFVWEIPWSSTNAQITEVLEHVFTYYNNIWFTWRLSKCI